MIALALMLAAAGTQQPILWRDIRAGMTAAEAESLYPEVKGEIHHHRTWMLLENVQQVGRCHPDVWIYYPKGVVTHVVISARGRGIPRETCGDEAAKALLAKYGPTTDKTVDNSGSAQRASDQTWVRDDVVIHFERDYPALDDDWHITYEVASSEGL